MAELTFPRMVYRVGTMVVLESGTYDYKIAASAEDADGWHLDQYAAKDAQTVKPADETPDDNAPPTRAELEQQARELGIDFDGRTTDKKLGARIAAAMKG